MMKILIGILLVCTIGCNTANANTVYKKINQDGSVQYSDLPFPGAIAITIKQSNQTTLPAVHFKPDTSSANNVTKANYQLKISSPESGATIRNNSGDFTIMVQTTASLSPSINFQLFLNNTPYGEASEDTVFKLKNIDRGEIKIKVQLQDNNGNLLATS
ncbi:MAG: hypothetical protein HRU24_12250, partial [Gammaproteobacteria bacterium]|nr:hypothetical protein [Gammaproteobacteria bacterium]